MFYLYPYQMSAHLVVSGEDAADFLQSQFSRDLRPFAQPHAVYGLWLDVKGKVVADSWVLCLGPESFHLFSEHGAPGDLAAKLEHHIVADEVIIQVAPPAPALAVIGCGAADLGPDFPGFALLPGRRACAPSVEAVFESLRARDEYAGLLDGETLSEEALQGLRLEAGVPLIPQEVGPGELPGEAGLDRDAVDFNKGCFLGQEVVARMRHVGKPTRGLYLLGGDGAPPTCPTSLSVGDRVVGELRSAYTDGARWRGVALLKLRHVTDAVELALPGRTARIVAPFNPGSDAR